MVWASEVDLPVGCSQTIRGQDTESRQRQRASLRQRQVAVKRSEVRILKDPASVTVTLHQICVAVKRSEVRILKVVLMIGKYVLNG